MKNRIFLAILLSLLSLQSWAQIGGDYNPENPSDPQEQARQFRFSVVAEPEKTGSFNIEDLKVEAGSEFSLIAYNAKSDYVFKHWMLGDSILSTDDNLTFVMPSHNVQLVGVFEYNPASPANPGSNHWDSKIGEVIVDDFKPGDLYNAIYYAINGNSSDDVAMITVAGRMNSNDFGIANYYPNCTLLDLSRVSGITEVPSYAFDRTNLESVYLPASIEKIGSQAFAYCANLSSLTLYSMTPPELGSNVFYNISEDLVLYVPAAAIAQYQDDETWGKFSILPIQEDIRSISVSLPAEAKTQDYAQMWLELTNTKSGQRMHYVMTDRQTYTFANIIRNTSWNVTLRNERGDVFGQIENVEVQDEDISVSFSSLAKPQHVSLSVKTPEGTDVTSETLVTWLDTQDKYLAQATGLAGQIPGNTVRYRVTLSQDLSMQYETPAITDYVVTDGNNTLQVNLTPIKQVTLSGNVKDLATKTALSGAIVTASQTFGGKYSKTLSAKTDAKGNYTLTVSNVPTSLAISASDYISQTLVCDSLMTGNDNITLSDISLKGISGAVISLSMSYTLCPTEESVEGAVQEWYADYNNISYSIYNRTKQKSIDQFNVQYPQIVLLEEVEEGDVLEMTATSKTGAFMPVKAIATIDAEQNGSAAFNIIELGKIKASYAQNSNPSVVGTLYDVNGKLVKSYDYSGGSLTINDLADGRYTLVSMGSSKLFNSIYDLSQLPQTGLVAGADYTQASVMVSSGKLAVIDIDEVPTLDESKLYYTGDNTSFTVNKSSIVAGNYLTLTGHIDFKSAYSANVSNVNLIVDLPESCQFVENSVMVGNSTSSYTLQNNRITIPLARYTDRVRFCIIPTLGGDYAPSALAQFDLDGKTITQPIGSANYTAKDLSISVPSTVAKTAVPISGTAIGASTIEIYDNNVLIGQTNSLANGSWATTCELNDPYNLSTHNIYAKVTTKNGIELTSENVSCTYDMDAIQVSKVMMYHDNPEMGKTYELTFDFLNPSDKEENYIYYIYNKKFTFTIDFTNNDTTKVSNVVLYVKTANSGWHPLEANYDSKLGMWYASGEFGNMYDGDLPVNVSVDYKTTAPIRMDRRSIDDIYSIISETQESINSIDAQYLSLINSVDDDSDDDVWLEAYLNAANLLGITIPELGDEEIVEKYDLQQLEELRLKIEQNHISLESFLSQDIYTDFSSISQEFESKVQVSSCGNIIESDLVESGFEQQVLSDGSVVYFKADEILFEYYDIVRDIHLVVRADNKLRAKIRSAAGSSIETVIAYIKEIKQLTDKFKDLLNLSNGAVSSVHRLTKNWLESSSKEYNKIFRQLQQIGRDAKKGIPVPGLLRSHLRLDLRLTLLEIKTCESTLKGITRISKGLAGISSVINAIGMCVDLSEYISLYNSPKLKDCPLNPQQAKNIRDRIVGEAIGTGAFYVLNIAADLVSLGAIPAGITLIPETAGGSLGAVLLAIGKVALSISLYEAHDKHVAQVQQDIRQKIRDLKCNENNPDNNENNDPDKEDKKKNGGGHKSGNKDKKYGIDPSGFVYEGVFSNRLEGVTATVYYKETVEDMYGDLHENIVKWDAAEYAQENPLFTDENGYYRWDVPQGLWQVKFEKEGYETTYSEWLPVPPPQLDVNIAMKQNRQPEVKNARAYEDAVEVEFDKYMMPELLNTDNIIVMAGDKQVEGSIKLLNEEVKYEGETETFASKLRFNAKAPFEGTEITLMVNNQVKSYAGIRMQDNYSQAFTIEPEIKQIACDSVFVVGYGDEVKMKVSLLPGAASKGKMLNVKTSSSLILGVETEQITVDDEGNAEISLAGNLPGTAALTFSVEGTDKTATTIVNVKVIGDINGDGVVNEEDLAILVDYLIAKEVTDYLYPNLDLNQDGDVTVSDLVTLIRILTRKVAV